MIVKNPDDVVKDLVNGALWNTKSNTYSTVRIAVGKFVKRDCQTGRWRVNRVIEERLNDCKNVVEAKFVDPEVIKV